jgi:hypothetical protein
MESADAPSGIGLNTFPLYGLGLSNNICMKQGPVFPFLPTIVIPLLFPAVQPFGNLNGDVNAFA